MIYDTEANSQIFPGSFTFPIENRTKAETEPRTESFIRHYANGNKSTKYHSYKKPHNHYWLNVNVSKNLPFKLLREIPWEISFPYLLIHFCFAATKIRSTTKIP